ncbi:MAG: hypothetical protein A2Y67_00595 [Candidatus Buchananbacteria bacterium RBG_13_39_9]|uniref:Uncharacterized protein n=1 Tax=Candidatus Buchananbacteria bacterium RBG_13_39_9 TaxID=1797531 RepID=A0A1G1XMM0_9BACT|nr:MAG: hypothetical protein A2Y67_00595 [Candidatus Buchananbacteria bacterium RBG_13_39_9]
MEDYKIKMNRISAILKNLDQNRVFTVEWVRHIEEMVAQAEKQIISTKEEIDKIKNFLELA